MRTLFKLGVLLLIAHALFRFIPPYWHHNQFENELNALSLEWGAPNDEEVMQHVLATAAKHEVPITREHVSVQRVRDHVLIQVAYAVPIEWLPTVHKPWEFTTSLDVWKIDPPRIPGR